MIRAKARVQFLTAAEGGRATPVFQGYSPNHNFGDPESREMQMGRFELMEQQQLAPGQTAVVTICFDGAANLAELIHPGRQWRVQEGGQLVAIGKVLEVVQTT